MRKINLSDSKAVAKTRESLAKEMKTVGIDANKQIIFTGGWFAPGTVVTLADKFGGVDKDGHLTTDASETLYFGVFTTEGKPIPVQHFATPRPNGNIGQIGFDEFDKDGVKQIRAVEGTLQKQVSQAFDEVLEIDGNTLADVAALLKCLINEGHSKFQYLGCAIQQMTSRKASTEVKGRNGWTPSEVYQAGYKRTKKVHFWKPAD